MNNPNENETPTHPLTPCYSYLAEYLRKIDRNGAQILHDCMDSAKTPADVMDVLTDVLRTRFQVDIIDESGASHDPVHIENLEDRENALAVIERATHFAPAAFAGEFMRLAPYILRNQSPAQS